MPNTLVMIIRHAEKPVPGGADFGVTEQGEVDPASLTVRGWQRAGGLCSFFSAACAYGKTGIDCCVGHGQKRWLRNPQQTA